MGGNASHARRFRHIDRAAIYKLLDHKLSRPVSYCLSCRCSAACVPAQPSRAAQRHSRPARDDRASRPSHRVSRAAPVTHRIVEFPRCRTCWWSQIRLLGSRPIPWSKPPLDSPESCQKPRPHQCRVNCDTQSLHQVVVLPPQDSRRYCHSATPQSQTPINEHRSISSDGSTCCICATWPQNSMRGLIASRHSLRYFSPLIQTRP